MQNDIHPDYPFVTVTLADGTEFTTRSTMGSDYKSEVDSSNHPFYTGKKTMVDTAGRVEKFMRRYGKSNAKQAAASQEEEAQAAAAKAAEAQDAAALGATTVDNEPVPGTAKPPASSPENPARDTEGD
jgi:large subunit ribosomal protein L31